MKTIGIIVIIILGILGITKITIDYILTAKGYGGDTFDKIYNIYLKRKGKRPACNLSLLKRSSDKMKLNLRIFKVSILRFIRKLKKRIGIREEVFEWQLFLINIDDIIQGFMFDITDELSIDILFNFTKEFLGTYEPTMIAIDTLIVTMDSKYASWGGILFYQDELMTEEDVRDMKRRCFDAKGQVR